MCLGMGGGGVETWGCWNLTGGWGVKMWLGMGEGVWNVNGCGRWG